MGWTLAGDGIHGTSFLSRLDSLDGLLERVLADFVAVVGEEEDVWPFFFEESGWLDVKVAETEASSCLDVSLSAGLGEVSVLSVASCPWLGLVPDEVPTTG